MTFLRALLYLLTAAPLSALWFGLLLAGGIAIPLTAITPLVVPVLVAYRALVWSGARMEAALLRDVLGVEIVVPDARYGDKGYVGRLRGIFRDPAFWREQTFLALRMLLGGTIAVGVVSAIGAGLGMVAEPIYYRWVDDQTFIWQVDSLGRAVALVPLGVATLAVSWFAVIWLARIWPPLGRLFLAGRSSAPRGVGEPTPVAAALRTALPVHAAAFVGLNVLMVVIWSVTTRDYFWPEWTVLPLAMLLAIHAWTVLVQDRRWGPRLAATPALGIHAGAALIVFGFLVCVWAVTGAGYFWPMWTLIGFGATLGVHALTVFAGARDRARLTERIDVLTTSRTGAVDAAEEELRRIERDLHDGAQARLVALGMSLGMAEQKLATDPEGVRALLEEARAGAGAALKELRDLARGIHPPILTDRGLGAAIGSLASGTPIPVDVAVELEARPDRAVETAAYFVAAEALANAAKHSGADRIRIEVARLGGSIVVRVVDDGRGGAEPGGPGLSGIRQRVEALDGSLTVTSPAGGPTIVEAVIPCGS